MKEINHFDDQCSCLAKNLATCTKCQYSKPLYPDHSKKQALSHKELFAYYRSVFIPLILLIALITLLCIIVAILNLNSSHYFPLHHQMQQTQESSDDYFPINL